MTALAGWVWPYVALVGLQLCCIIYLFFAFISRFSRDALSRDRLFYAALTHFIITVLMFILAPIYHVLWASGHFFIFAFLPYAVSYVLQFYVTCCYLFLRLHLVFLDTSYRLSRLTVTIYRSVLVLGPLVVVGGIIMIWSFGFDIRVISAIQALIALFGIAVALSLAVLFVYKLAQIANRVDCDNHNDLVLRAVIVRNTILAVTSFAFTALLIVVFAAVSVTGTWWLAAFAILLDAFSNSLCIALSFKIFDGLYWKLCGCADSICKGRVMRASVRPPMVPMASASNETTHSVSPVSFSSSG